MRLLLIRHGATAEDFEYGDAMRRKDAYAAFADPARGDGGKS